MRSRKYIFFSTPFYLTAALSLSAYIIADILPQMHMRPGIRVLAVGIFCVFAYVGSRILCKTPLISKKKVMRVTFFIFFVSYLYLLLTFTLFDPMFGRSGYESFIFSDRTLLKEYLSKSFNIIPFATIFEYINALLTRSMSISAIVNNLLGNLLVLTPLALFLPMFFQKCGRLRYFALYSAATVAIIELLQLVFVTGSCDIDDLILNVFGACIAFVILKTNPVRRVVDMLIPGDDE